MKTLVAEDGLAPSAYRQVSCDLYHVAPPRLDWAGFLQNLRNWRNRKLGKERLAVMNVSLQFCMILFYTLSGVTRKLHLTVFL